MPTATPINQFPGQTLSGVVFIDGNGDGKWEATEKSGVGEISVVLTGASVTATVLTLANGSFSFGGLSPGTYTIKPTIPSNYKLTTPAEQTHTLHGTDTPGVSNFGVVPNSVTVVTQFGNPLLYIDAVNGSDANTGADAAHALKTIRAKSNTSVVLVPGQTYNVSNIGLSFANVTNCWVGSPDPTNPAIIQTTATPVGGYSFCTQYSDQSNNCTLANVTLTSPDGRGCGGNVHGTNLVFNNVNFGNLSEGLDPIGPCVGLTILGGKQIGSVIGRCWYFTDVTNLVWIGGIFGPGGYPPGQSQEVNQRGNPQSPSRASSPGIRGTSVISGATIDQSQSTDPIAALAGHALDNVQIINFTAIGGEFSFDGAGEGNTAPVPDKVSGCQIENLTTVNTKVHIGSITFGCTFSGGSWTNSTGEQASVQCVPGSGNVIENVDFYSPNGKHCVMFYTPSDLIVRNCRWHGPIGTLLLDGAFTAANLGPGNVFVEVAATASK